MSKIPFSKNQSRILGNEKRYGQCIIYLKQEKYEETLLNVQDEEIKEEYKCILKVNKRDANAHFLLGRLYQREGNLNKAIYEYRMASKLSEKYNALFFLKEGV